MHLPLPPGVRSRICPNVLFTLEGSVPEFARTCRSGWRASFPNLPENVVQVGGLRSRICPTMLCKLGGSVPEFARNCCSGWTAPFPKLPDKCCSGWRAPFPEWPDNVVQAGRLRSRICPKICLGLEGSVPEFARIAKLTVRS